MKLMLALMALAISGCNGCSDVRWPQNTNLPAHVRYARYVALSLKAGGQMCADETKSKAELAKCDKVYSELKPTLIRLEEEP